MCIRDRPIIILASQRSCDEFWAKRATRGKFEDSYKYFYDVKYINKVINITPVLSFCVFYLPFLPHTHSHSFYIF